MEKYEQDYHSNKHKNLYDNEKYYIARSRVARYDYFRKNVKRKDKVLDFGCGLGQNIYLIDNAVGYDVSKFAVEFCKGRGIKAFRNLDKIKDKSFDVVFSCEVLEHVEEPLTELRKMNSKLKKGGKLILVIPIEKEKKPELDDENQHLYIWSKQAITNLLLRAGFHPVDYKIMRRTGFKKLLFLKKINFKLYLLFTNLAALVFGSRHLRVMAIKK